MTFGTWSLSMVSAVAPLRHTGRVTLAAWKGAPSASREEMAHIEAGPDQCHACYRVLFALQGILGNCFSRLWLLLLLLYGLVIAPQFAFARSVGKGFGAAALRRAGWGPLHVTVQSPIQQKRLGFIHESPALNAPGSWELRTGVTLANQWILEEGKLIIDEDVWSINQTFEYTASKWVAFSLRIPAQFLGRGYLDGVIEGFHSTTGLNNARREEFPRNQFRAEVMTEDGTMSPLMSQGEGSLRLGAPVLAAKVRLTPPGSVLPLALKAAVNFPNLEDETLIVQRDGHDWALGISGASRLSENLAGTVSYAIVRSRPGTLLATNDLARRQASLLLSLDYQVLDSLALVGQLLRESAVASGTGTRFDRPSMELTLGAKWAATDDSVLEFGFVENVAVQGNSADVALHFGVNTSFN